MRRFPVVIVVLLILAGTVVPTAVLAAPTVPDTPVGRQVSWLLDVSRRLPMTAAEAAQHLTPDVLAALPVEVANAFLAELASTGGLELVSYDGTDTSAKTVMTGGDHTWLIDVAVSTTGLIEGFFVRAPAPASWQEIDQRLRQLAPHVSFLAAEVTPDGTCEPVHTLKANRARPIGSAFKLYVLGALAEAVRSGSARWDEPLAIRDEWKSLPSGNLQNVPAGTRYPLSFYADKMISISDNTATDHLIHRLDATAVERQQQEFGIAGPEANEPFLTTRQMFQLKLNDYPTLAQQYEALDGPQRRTYLSGTIDPLPLPAPAPWAEPRHVDDIEWFASPADICRALVGLNHLAADPALGEVGHALSINDGGVDLDRGRWQRVWFKGGSEPGMLTLNYLASTVDGRTFVVSVMLNDRHVAFDEEADAIEGLALVNGAFNLSAG
jgi:beta-lactamase class A